MCYLCPDCSATAAVTILSSSLANAQTILWQSQFNTPGQTAADDGGFIGGFYGGGDPFFQNDPAIVVETNTAGLGPDSSSCLRAVGTSLGTGANYSFFGTFVQNIEGVNGPDPDPGLNISAGTVLKFDLRLGAPGAHSSFNVKLEDVVPTGPGDFNNTNTAITPAPVDTAWTSYEIPLSTFTAGAQPVDLTQWSQIVIEASAIPASSTVNLSLLVDNIQFVQNPSNVSDWAMYD